MGLLNGRDKKIAYFFLFLTLIVNSLDIVALSLIGVIASVAVADSSTQTDFFFLSAVSNSTILLLMIGTAMIFVTKTIAGLLLTRRRQLFLARLEGDFSRIITRYTFSADLSRVKQYSKAHLEWIILRSTNIAFSRVMTQAFTLFAEGTLALSIFVLFVVVDWQAALFVSLYFFTILLLFQLFSRNQSKRHGASFASGSVGVVQAISDFTSAFREISILNAREFFLSRVSEARATSALSEARQLYLQAIPRLIVELALIVGALAFVIFELSTSGGDPDFGVLGIFLFGSLRMMSALLPLQRAYSQLLFDGPQARDATDVVRSSLSLTDATLPSEEGVEDGPPSPLPTGGLSVSFSNVTFAFEDSNRITPVLEDLNLSIQENTVVALIGPSGAGKSTIVDLMLGLHKPNAGEIKIDQYSASDIQKMRAGIVGYVPQKPGIVSGTVRDNIALGQREADIDSQRLWAAIENAELRELIESLPSGVNTPIGSHVDGLSGGQLQRIGLARALYLEPQLLVLDEATSALDARTEATISDGIGRLRGKMTVVIVAHRLSTVKHADEIFVVDCGRIIGKGSLSQLSRSVPLVKDFLNLLASGDTKSGP